MKKQERRAFNSSLRPMSPKKQKQAEDGTLRQEKYEKAIKKAKDRREVKGTSAIERLLGEGKIKKASQLEVGTPRKPMNRRSANNKGWVDVAQAIWDDPANGKSCEVCGVSLGDEFSPTFYHHLLHRGSYRKMKRRPDNLAQVCMDDHDKAHKYGVENMAEEGSENAKGWMLLATRLVALRNEANGL